MSKKNSKKAFVDAVRSRGGVRYFDLGGQATTSPNNVASGLKAGDPFSGVPIIGDIGGKNSDIAGGVIGGVGNLVQSVGGAFTAQNGYQAQLAPTQNLDYSGTVNQASQQALSGYGQTAGNLGNEQALEQQLLAQSQGQGPNPAQAALANNTQTNVANQAALMANQRGGSANAGLIARQAAQQGAQTQQQAVGQSAALEAQQRLAAQQGAAALQGQIGNQITNQQAASNQLLGIGAGATNTQNANLISNYGQAQGINSQVAQQNANAVNQTTSGLLGGASSLLALFAEGGEVAPAAMAPKASYAEGGPVSVSGQFLNSSPNELGEFANVGSGVGQTASAAVPVLAQAAQTAEGTSKGLTGIGKSVAGMATGGQAPFTAAKGKKVPGDAKVKGDSLKNDTVPAMLSPGEIVLPRHVTQAPDAPQRAAAFVQAIQAKQGLKRGKK
jgi:hypothetical protein